MSNTKIIHGDRITAHGLSFVADRILYQDYFGSRADALPCSDCWGYDVEFIDTKGRYHHWKQNQDGGQVARWNGHSWQAFNVDGVPVQDQPAIGKISFPGYGPLEYLDPVEYSRSDAWEYESTEEGIAGEVWDIVSRRDSFPCLDCRYTTINN